MDTDSRLLSPLLAARGDFVPGNVLAEALGVTRVAVWGRLEKLREQGLGIEARRHHGYRLVAEPEELHEALLRAYASSMGMGADLYVYPTVDSTNTEAERLLAAGAEVPFVVVANEQTAGRGRMGRRWHSPERGNLYASFAFRPDLPPRDMPVITLWFGLAIASCLRDDFSLPIRIKWPNDLLLDGRKVAGLLTEARIDADRTRDLVFGLGLNIIADTASWPDAVQRRATTLAAAAAQPLSVNRTAIAVIKATFGAYARFLAGDRKILLRDWKNFDALEGQRVEIDRAGEMITGIAAGIDSEGRLRLRLDDGKELSLHSGEVSLGSGPRP